MTTKAISALVIQANYPPPNSGKWFDIFTYGETLDEVREELQRNKERNPSEAYRIIQRTIITEELEIP